MTKKAPAKKRTTKRASSAGNTAADSATVDPVKTFSLPGICPRCQSREHSDYENVTTKDIGGIAANDRKYTSMSWERTTCLDCGQTRIDRVFVLASDCGS